MTNEIRKLAKNTLGQFNTPKAYRDLPTSQQALTRVTLPTGKVVWLFGFAHERQVATCTRKHLRELQPVETAHLVVERGTRNIIETRATFIDLENGISRREA